MPDKCLDDNDATKSPTERKAEVRQQRLALQLRKNLQKRKKLTRTRKVSDRSDD